MFFRCKPPSHCVSHEIVSFGRLPLCRSRGDKLRPAETVDDADERRGQWDVSVCRDRKGAKDQWLYRDRKRPGEAV